MGCRTLRNRRNCLIVMGLGVAAFAALIVWDLLHRGIYLQILTALLIMTVAGVAALYALIDNWASRYDQAFEVGYRMRDLDDRQVPEPRSTLHVVEPSESRS